MNSLPALIITPTDAPITNAKTRAANRPSVCKQPIMTRYSAVFSSTNCLHMHY